jgi:hypothetical protein
MMERRLTTNTQITGAKVRHWEHVKKTFCFCSSVPGTLTVTRRAQR